MQSNLQTHLDRLMPYVKSLSGQPLVWSHVLIAEGADVTHDGRIRVPRASLVTTQEYSSQFDALLQTGYSRINVNAAGVCEDALIVIIERPSHPNAALKGKVPVNLSGPLIHVDHPIVIVD